MNICQSLLQLPDPKRAEETYEANLDQVLEPESFAELDKSKMTDLTFCNGDFRGEMDTTSPTQPSPDQLSSDQSSPDHASFNGMSPSSKSGADFYSELCNNNLESSLDIDDTFSCSSFEKISVPEKFRIDDLILTNFLMTDEAGSGYFSYEQAYIDYYLSELSEQAQREAKEDSFLGLRTGWYSAFRH